MVEYSDPRDFGFRPETVMTALMPYEQYSSKTRRLILGIDMGIASVGVCLIDIRNPAAKEKSQMPTARQSAKSMFSIGLNIPPEAIAHVLMETRSHAALPHMTPRLRFQVWVKGITPPSSSTTSFPISRRAISPTDGLNAPASEAAPDLSPRNSAPAPLCLSQGYKARTSIAR